MSAVDVTIEAIRFTVPRVAHCDGGAPSECYRYEHYDPQSKVADVRDVPLADLADAGSSFQSSI